ncbi:putative reverse transcriptase, RNA-dependent DNA polymerase [Tanacetum coccineum]
MSNALADLGASINIMPYFLFKRLGLESMKPIKMTIEMADRSMQSPKGIKENVLVKISNFVFPVHFVILDIMEDENVPIILGRPMLATARAKIDVYGKKISLGVGNDQVVFNNNKKESPAFISPICIINEVDKTQELVMNDEKGIKSLLEDGDNLIDFRLISNLEAMLREFLVLILLFPIIFISLMYNRDIVQIMGDGSRINT